MAPTRATDPLGSLTERELEVLSLLAQGRSNAAIARQLWTTRRTIETHVRHVFAKLGLLDSDSDSRRVVAVLVYLRNRGGREPVAGACRHRTTPPAAKPAASRTEPTTSIHHSPSNSGIFRTDQPITASAAQAGILRLRRKARPSSRKVPDQAAQREQQAIPDHLCA